MNSKERLEELKDITEYIKSKRLMATTYRELAEGMTSPKLTDMPKSKSSIPDPMAETLIKAIELEQEADELEKELLVKKSKLTDIIVQLDRNQQILILNRYFENLTMMEIAEKLHYTERWVYKLHQDALKEMDKIQKSSC